MKQRIAPSAYDEAELVPGLLPDEIPHVVRAEPSADRERDHRPQGEADRRVDQAQPLSEEIAAEKASGLAGNRRDDDLQRLQQHEEHGREDAPLAQRFLEEVLVQVQPDEQAVRGRIGQDQPRAVARHERDRPGREDPAIPRDHHAHRIAIDAIAARRGGGWRWRARLTSAPVRATAPIARTSRSEATTVDGSAGARPAR